MELDTKVPGFLNAEKGVENMGKALKLLARAIIGMDSKTIAKVIETDAGKWDESKHPRGKGGKFASKGSGGGGGGGSEKGTKGEKASSTGVLSASPSVKGGAVSWKKKMNEGAWSDAAEYLRKASKENIDAKALKSGNGVKAVERKAFENACNSGINTEARRQKLGLYCLLRLNVASGDYGSPGEYILKSKEFKNNLSDSEYKEIAKEVVKGSSMPSGYDFSLPKTSNGRKYMRQCALINKGLGGENMLPYIDEQLPPKGKAKESQKSGSLAMNEPGSGYDPFNGAKPKTPEQKANLESIAKARSAASDMCKEKAKKWPEGSEEREIYERYADSMSKPQAGRPTEAQSKAMTQKYLSNISSQLKPYAVDRYKKDLANEPAITKDMCDIADALGTEMFNLDYRLKKASDSSDGGCRIAEKIAEDMEKKGLSYEQATDKLSDMVRYTQACTGDNLVENFKKTRKMLERKGYEPVKIKNTWDSYDIENAYRGVNCVFKSPTGTKFELQFHTPESLVGKEVQHPQYEEQRKPTTPQKRKDELGQMMYKNMSGMKRPNNVERIQNYP